MRNTLSGLTEIIRKVLTDPALLAPLGITAAGRSWSGERLEQLSARLHSVMEVIDDFERKTVRAFTDEERSKGDYELAPGNLKLSGFDGGL